MDNQPVLSNPKQESPPNGQSMNTDDVNKTLFLFCVVWNFVYLAGSILAFFNTAYHVPHAGTMIYLSLVGSYTLHNEINRWNGKLLGVSRHGQKIFYCWVGVASIMVFVQYATKDKYVFHEEMLEFIYGLFAIFASNEVSKKVRSRFGNGHDASPPVSKQ